MRHAAAQSQARAAAAHQKAAAAALAHADFCTGVQPHFGDALGKIRRAFDRHHPHRRVLGGHAERKGWRRVHAFSFVIALACIGVQASDGLVKYKRNKNHY